MEEFEFTVTQTAQVFIEANSEEDAREQYENNPDVYYAQTQFGEVPTDESWKLEPKFDQAEFDKHSSRVFDVFEMAHGRGGMSAIWQHLDENPTWTVAELMAWLYEDEDEDEEEEEEEDDDDDEEYDDLNDHGLQEQIDE